MKKHLVKKFALLCATASILLLSGCPRPKLPTPSDTISSGGYTTTTRSQNTQQSYDNSISPQQYTNTITTTDGDMIPARSEGDTTQALDNGRGVLESIYFDFNQYGIKASERAKADAAKSYLDSNPGTKLVLEGHCDWRGTAEYNLGLGDRRAAGVKKYLQDLGVDASRLETLSRGDLDAIENASEADMIKDRRVEFIIKK